VFSRFRIGVSDLQFVPQFKYLAHIITHRPNLSDDNDIQREVRSMFVRCNILISKFSSCSRGVKLKLFHLCCRCFYNIALWYLYSIGSLSKFRSCYNKCIKLFLGTKSMTVLLAFYLKLVFQALTLYVTMPSVLSVHDGCLAATQWCPCCAHVCHAKPRVCFLYWLIDRLIDRVAVDMDIHGCIHGYIHGYIHVWIADLGCTMDISMDISTSFNLNCHITSFE